MPDLSVVSIDLVEYEGGSWRLDGSVNRGLTEPPDTFEIRENGEKLPFRYVPRPAEVKIEGRLLKDRVAFSAELPYGELGRETVIEFVCVDGVSGRETVLPVVSVNYQARVSSFLKHSYWCFRAYMVTMRECGRPAGDEAAAPGGNCGADEVAAPDGDCGTDEAVASNGDCGDDESAVPDGCGGERAARPVMGSGAAVSPGILGDEAAAGTAQGGRKKTTADAPWMPAAGWRDGLMIRRTGKPGRMRQELRLLTEMLFAPYGSRQMFAVRCAYWLARPFYAEKRIWITFDKLYKGGDCGEYFYKYMVSRKEAGIVPVYVIRGDVPDCARLRREGYSPAVHRSLRQRLSYLYASVVFGTHSGVNSFCGFNNWEIRFVQDRLCAVNTCIQHGLSVQDLSGDSNRVVNNNKRYYCASRCEIGNLSKPEYDYGPGVLRLTGIPRYDGLVDRQKRQVLIAPTWRADVAMPSVMGKTRRYNPEFRGTEYYRIYQALLEDEELVETAKRNGYRIIFLLHPVLGAQKGDFRVPGKEAAGALAKGEEMTEAGVLVTDQEVSYEQLLTEASLLVTDYSGIQFDFAYMRKPLVYFHPPELPPHYRDGGFSYEEQGFGEICTGLRQLVAALCGYMESGCRLKDTYRVRQDAFFAFDDRENCRRIYEDALELDPMSGLPGMFHNGGRLAAWTELGDDGEVGRS